MLEDPSNQQQLSIHDYWDIALRRRWWILLPSFICWAAVWGVSWLLPETYRSDALILVEPQKVPEQYVLPNVTINVEERLQSITQEILSRARLQAIIDSFHLYPRPNALMALFQSGDPVERMRKDIDIELVQPGGPDNPGQPVAFKIHYSAGSRGLAQQVNSRLTSLFIDESSRTQQELSQNTTDFLASQLAAAKSRLQEQEARVSQFKARHLGVLPSQLETNIQILSGLQAQLQETQRSIDAARQQKLYLESLLHQYQAAQAGLAKAGVSSTPETLGKHLQELRQQLTAVRSLYTDNYPDVVALNEEIAKTEKLKAQIERELASNQKAGKATDSQETSGEPDESSAMMEIRSQLKANQLEIQNYQHDEKALQGKITDYQGRLNLTPAIEQEMTEITRGYEESQSNYNSLLQKQMQSQLATSLERRSQGEHFRLIDQASLPVKATAPNHLAMSLGGLAAGLAVGLVLIVLLELTNVRIRHEKDLEGLVPARVLVGIPRLSTPADDRRLALTRMLEICAVAALACTVVAGSLYAFYKG